MIFNNINFQILPHDYGKMAYKLYRQFSHGIDICWQNPIYWDNDDDGKMTYTIVQTIQTVQTIQIVQTIETVQTMQIVQTVQRFNTV